MEWKQIGNDFIAKGKEGKFFIQKKGKYYYASYLSVDNYFQFPRNSNLNLIKQMCEDNYYWEETSSQNSREPILISDESIDF